MDYFARLVCAGGSPDVVIANAGVIHVRRPIWELPAETWQAVLSVNVSGVAHTARAFLPEMIRSGKRGLFIAISSGWGAKPAEGLGPYCASKFAVEGIVAVLNRELPNGIRAIALDPGGGVDTDMLASCLPEEHGDYISPSLWAEAAATYVLSDLFHGDVAGTCVVPHAGKR
jgi:NAD(P)-dependent dehydrogenase (short-subunit alcohol dehydrogenase family)